MNTYTKLLALIATALSPLTTVAQTDLYGASSRAQGAPFDITVTETSREESRSLLSVPGFHSRTAPAARWLMCAYTDLALKRGFSHWAVLYPPEGSEVVSVGFSNSPATSPREVVGPEYAEERMLGKGMTPTEKFMVFCGLRK